MSVIDTLAHWILPAPAAHVLDVAEQVPAAVTAFAAEWNAGRGPIAALRAFGEATEGQLDDVAVEQLEAWLREAIAAGLVATDAAGRFAVWLEGVDLAVRIEQGRLAVIDAAYQLGSWSATARGWLEPPT